VHLRGNLFDLCVGVLVFSGAATLSELDPIRQSYTTSP
jgi:hypothetical protein